LQINNLQYICWATKREQLTDRTEQWRWGRIT